MAQAGIHALVAMAVQKDPERAWLMLGIVLGSMLPDADNLAVAVATVAKLPTEGTAPHLHPQPVHHRRRVGGLLPGQRWSASSRAGTTWGSAWGSASCCTSCSTC